MKSALPGVVLIVGGALLAYWAMTQLGLLVPKASGGSTTGNQFGNRPDPQGTTGT